jgi:hypothetical protein
MYNLSYMTMHLKWGFLHRKKTSEPLKKYFRKFWCLNMQFLWKRSKCLSQSEAREVIFDFKTFKKVTKLLQNHWRNISGKSGDFKWSCFGEKKKSQKCRSHVGFRIALNLKWFWYKFCCLNYMYVESFVSLQLLWIILCVDWPNVLYDFFFKCC